MKRSNCYHHSDLSQRNAQSYHKHFTEVGRKHFMIHSITATQFCRRSGRKMVFKKSFILNQDKKSNLKFFTRDFQKIPFWEKLESSCEFHFPPVKLTKAFHPASREAVSGHSASAALLEGLFQFHFLAAGRQ